MRNLSKKNVMFNENGFFCCKINATTTLLEIIGFNNQPKNQIHYLDRVKLTVEKLKRSKKIESKIVIHENGGSVLRREGRLRSTPEALRKKTYHPEKTFINLRLLTKAQARKRYEGMI